MAKRRKLSGQRARGKQSTSVPDLQTLFVAAQKHAQEGDFEKAKPLFLRIDRVEPNSPEVLHWLGFIALEEGEAERAVGHLQEVGRLTGGGPGFWNLLGCAQIANGALLEASKSFEKALAFDPRDTSAHFNYAKLLASQGDAIQADDHFKCAHATMPDDRETCLVYANFLNRFDAFEQACSVVTPALERNKHDKELQACAGTAFAGAGRIRDALEQYLAVLERHPDADGLYKKIRALLLADEPKVSEFSETSAKILENIRLIAPQPHEVDLLEMDIKASSRQLTENDYQKAIRLFPSPEDETVSIETSTSSRKKISRVPKLPEYLVALIHWGRSGSGFFHSLIDGHPQISTLPGHYLADYFGRWTWNHISSTRLKDMVQRFIERHEVLFDATAKQGPPGFEMLPHFGVNEGYANMGENRDQALSVGRKAFQRNLLRILEGRDRIERATFFRAVHLAFEQTISRSEGASHIFFHIHSPNRYGLVNYLRHCPESKLLLTVRDPLQNLESWISSAIDDSQPYDIIAGKAVGFLFTFDRQEFSIAPSRGVRLEDLKFETHKTLNALCQWIGVDDDPALYVPTFQGLKWWGDMSTKRFGRTETVIGFEEDQFEPATDPVKRKVGYLLSERDQYVFETLLQPVRVLYGYAERDDRALKKNLNAIEPLLAQPFDFERRFVDGLAIGAIDFERNVSSRAFRRALWLRWSTLKSKGDYAGMIRPLVDHSS